MKSGRDSARGSRYSEERPLTVPLVLESWLRDQIVDPVSKKRFVSEDPDGFLSPCGFQYRYTDGVPDFRVAAGEGRGIWKKGQEAFAQWFEQYLERGEMSEDFYPREQERDKKVYEQLHLQGRVLDVGGQLGHIRKYMASDQQYCSIDPFVGVQHLVRGCKNLFANYPLDVPLNFLGGFAEYLPLSDQSFDTVNMRSCIDHFFNAEMALLEAFRVLKKRGRLIIGLKIEGHSFRSRLLECARGLAGTFVPRYKDHHIWHPSYTNLMALCSDRGFELEKEYWQTSDVLYASFLRRDTQLVTLRE